MKDTKFEISDIVLLADVDLTLLKDNGDYHLPVIDTIHHFGFKSWWAFSNMSMRSIPDKAVYPTLTVSRVDLQNFIEARHKDTKLLGFITPADPSYEPTKQKSKLGAAFKECYMPAYNTLVSSPKDKTGPYHISRYSFNEPAAHKAAKENERYTSMQKIYKTAHDATGAANKEARKTSGKRLDIKYTMFQTVLEELGTDKPFLLIDDNTLLLQQVEQLAKEEGIKLITLNPWHTEPSMFEGNPPKNTTLKTKAELQKELAEKLDSLGVVLTTKRSRKSRLPNFFKRSRKNKKTTKTRKPETHQHNETITPKPTTKKDKPIKETNPDVVLLIARRATGSEGLKTLNGYETLEYDTALMVQTLDECKQAIAAVPGKKTYIFISSDSLLPDVKSLNTEKGYENITIAVQSLDQWQNGSNTNKYTAAELEEKLDRQLAELTKKKTIDAQGEDFNNGDENPILSIIDHCEQSHIDLSKFPLKGCRIENLLFLIDRSQQNPNITSIKLSELSDLSVEESGRLKAQLAKNQTLSKIEIMGTPNQATVLAFVMGSTNANKHFEIIIDISRCNSQQEINKALGFLKAFQTIETVTPKKQETSDSDSEFSENDDVTSSSLQYSVNPSSSEEDSEPESDPFTEDESVDLNKIEIMLTEIDKRTSGEESDRQAGDFFDAIQANDLRIFKKDVTFGYHSGKNSKYMYQKNPGTVDWKKTLAQLTFSEDEKEAQEQKDHYLLEAARCGAPRVIHFLLQQGARVNAQNGFKYTALYLSILHVDCVELLLAYNANPNTVDNSGHTPLYRALETKERVTLLNLLLDHGADPNMDREPQAITYIERITPTPSPLHYTVLYDHEECTALLLKAGASVDVITPSTGDTPLHLAVKRNYVDVLKLLIPHATKVNIQNSEGWAILHRAAAGDDPHLVKQLLKQGANPIFKNKAGMTAFALATDPEIKNLLTSAAVSKGENSDNGNSNEVSTSGSFDISSSSEYSEHSNTGSSNKVPTPSPQTNASSSESSEPLDTKNLNIFSARRNSQDMSDSNSGGYAPSFWANKCNGVHFAIDGYQNDHAGKSVVYKGFLRGTRARFTITHNQQGKLTLKKGFFTNTRAQWRGDGEMFPDLKAIIHRQRYPFANTLRTFRVYKAANHHVDHECHVHNDDATQPLL